MKEIELETSRMTINLMDVKRIEELELWFRYEYPSRLHKIERYKYLGLPLPETRYALEMEAYNKENELRSLRGEQPLPELKLHKII